METMLIVTSQSFDLISLLKCAQAELAFFIFHKSNRFPQIVDYIPYRTSPFLEIGDNSLHGGLATEVGNRLMETIYIVWIFIVITTIPCSPFIHILQRVEIIDSIRDHEPFFISMGNPVFSVRTEILVISSLEVLIPSIRISLTDGTTDTPTSATDLH